MNENFHGKKRKRNIRMLFQAVEKSDGAEQMFTDLVAESEKKYDISDCIYSGCVEEVRKIRLNQLDEQTETRIFRPFLLTWGAMGRVLGYSGVNTVCKKLHDLDSRIEPLRQKDLISENLVEIKRSIIELFDEIRQTEFKSAEGNSGTVGPTATSKALHLVCPNLFIMWDVKIRNEYGKIKGNGEDYFEFLCEMRTFSQALEGTVKNVEHRFGRRRTRIIDQYNWMKTQWLNK
jgi:hypothetical protein